MINFEQALDTVIHRDNDLRRHEIAKDAREAIADFHAGKLKPQSAKDIITKLRQS
jgi:hypothetical protein